jgi:hypothetical protein
MKIDQDKPEVSTSPLVENSLMAKTRTTPVVAEDQTSEDSHVSDHVEDSLTEKAIDEMTRGMVYASLAITDDRKGTLLSVGKTNPWQVEALRIVTGSDEKAHKPLTEILETAMKLKVDKLIDESGVTKGMYLRWS